MLITLLLGCALFLIVLFFPVDLFRKRAVRSGPDSQVDERDVMFARMSRVEGTPEYDEYYERRPELKKEDDRIRAMIPLYLPGSRYYHPEITGEAERYFESIYDIEPDPAIIKEWQERFQETVDNSGLVREMVRALGAVAVGFAPLPHEYIYTHKGRFAEDYGHEIRLDHPTAIVFLIEMDFGQMQRAPHAEAIRESARQYYRAAVIARTVEATLKAAGYGAKAHYDAHYDVILPPLAIEAGLGEIGRNNILIADRFGSRVRIGAVTTDLRLKHDGHIRLGADEFCSICRKCAENCPSRALSAGEKEWVRGVEKWTTDTEKCYSYWRQVGSDCGICMAVCPFSHRNNWLHNLVRMMIPLNPWLRRIALIFDDLIYGRKWRPGRAIPKLIQSFAGHQASVHPEWPDEYRAGSVSG